ncbi:MAG: hypothetical protein JWL64_286 [Frankiales bacterium]|nr:hypothetical protein [Frankiales bacterium]
MRAAWAGLQQMSKAALVALVVVLLVILGLELAGRDASVGLLSGFVAAAAVLVDYTEWDAGRKG